MNRCTIPALALASAAAAQPAAAQAPQEMMVCSATMAGNFGALKDPAWRLACTEVLNNTEAKLSLHDLVSQGWQMTHVTSVKGTNNVDILTFWSWPRGAGPAAPR